MNLTAITLFEWPVVKIFHELDVHHVEKLGIKRFWAHEAEMSLAAITSFELGW